jgi:hypothetical protein
MHIFVEPYRMVVVNVILLTFTLLSLGFVKFVLKKNIPPVFIVLIFSLLPVVSILRTGAYESGDFNIQIYRAIDFYNSLLHGILIPRWASILNAHYGDPVFIFSAPLQYYLISFFHFLGLSFIFSAKTVLIMFYIFSGLTMYLFSKKNYGDKAAVISAIFYLYAPFHLVDLHFRASFGDVIALAIYPLSFLFASNLLKKYSTTNYIFFSIVIFFLIISHPITLTAIFFLVLYSIFIWYFKEKNLLNLTIVALGIINGLLLSAFYWLPLIAESKYTYDGAYLKLVSFLKISDLVKPPWKLGLLFQGNIGELSFFLGYTQIFIIVLSLYFLITAKKMNYISKNLSFWLSSLFILFFLITPYSKVIWETFRPADNIQFTFRLLFITTFIISILAGISSSLIKSNKIIALMCFCAIILTILNWGHRRVISTIDDKYLIKNAPYSTYQGEGNSPEQPIWRDAKNPWMKIVPKDSLEIIKGKGRIIQVQNFPNRTEYVIRNESNNVVRKNTFYFPGWKAYEDNNEIPIQYKKTGIMTLYLQPGVHKLDLYFEDVKEIKIAKDITIIGFIMLFTCCIVLKYKNA